MRKWPWVSMAVAFGLGGLATWLLRDVPAAATLPLCFLIGYATRCTAQWLQARRSRP